MLRLSELSGLWRRSLLARPDGTCDTTSKVQWLQGLGTFGDLRQPAHFDDFSQVRCLQDLSRTDCEKLAQQQAFAGYLTFDGNYYEWTRCIDFQPKDASPDVGSLRWERGMLIEEGRDVRYIEHWHRDHAVKIDAPLAGATGRHRQLDVPVVIVRVGDLLMYARDRRVTLPRRTTLIECVADADDIEHARAMVDCEISLATATTSGFRIQASTLPFRVGQLLQDHRACDWDANNSEGDIAVLRL